MLSLPDQGFNLRQHGVDVVEVDRETQAPALEVLIENAPQGLMRTVCPLLRGIGLLVMRLDAMRGPVVARFRQGEAQGCRI